MSLERAIQVAQQIVDALVDIRPHYRELIVIDVILVPHQVRTVEITFCNGDTEQWAGLYAKEILKHLPESML